MTNIFWNTNKMIIAMAGMILVSNYDQELTTKFKIAMFFWRS